MDILLAFVLKSLLFSSSSESQKIACKKRAVIQKCERLNGALQLFPKEWWKDI